MAYDGEDWNQHFVCPLCKKEILPYEDGININFNNIDKKWHYKCYKIFLRTPITKNMLTIFRV